MPEDLSYLVKVYQAPQALRAYIRGRKDTKEAYKVMQKVVPKAGDSKKVAMQCNVTQIAERILTHPLSFWLPLDICMRYA